MTTNNNTNNTTNSYFEIPNTILKVYDPKFPWIYTHENNIPSELKIKQKLERIGKKSSYGDVYKIGTDNKYVLKIMVLNDDNDVVIFKNEVRVGSIDGIEAAGPKIYAYLYDDDIGVYIMDNILKGRKNHVLYSMYDYFKNVFGGSKECPSIRHIFYRKLRRTLIRFYNITKGYHGDLHTENIMVVLDSNKKLVDIRIIDYGSHRPFRNTSETTCLESLFDRINEEWITYDKKNKMTIHQGTLVKWPHNGQPYRMNSQVLTSSVSNTFMQRLFKNKSKYKKILEDKVSSTKQINNKKNNTRNNTNNTNNTNTDNNSYASSRSSGTKKYPRVSTSKNVKY